MITRTQGTTLANNIEAQQLTAKVEQSTSQPVQTMNVLAQDKVTIGGHGAANEPTYSRGAKPLNGGGYIPPEAKQATAVGKMDNGGGYIPPERD